MNKFDELAKGLAQSVTRRQAFKRFGVGLLAVWEFRLEPEAHPLQRGQNAGIVW